MNVGLATGLIGGGMLVPLGPVFSDRSSTPAPPGFGIFIFALGTGVAVGVVLLSVFQRHIPKAAGLRRRRCSSRASSLIVAASMSALGFASLFVGVLGVCAGSVYVLGFTLLHENVDDELRGRIFSRALHAGALLRADRLRGRPVPRRPARPAQRGPRRRRDHGRRRHDRRARRAAHAVARRADHHGRRRAGARVAAGRRRGRRHRQPRARSPSTSSCSRRAPSSCPA